jgi:hypothetical protein
MHTTLDFTRLAIQHLQADDLDGSGRLYGSIATNVLARIRCHQRSIASKLQKNHLQFYTLA